MSRLMRYRYVDPDSARTTTRKNDALQADIQAYTAELDHRMKGGDETDPPKEIKTIRKVAEARLAVEDVTPEEIRAARKQFLTNWIQAMEQDHVNHATLKELKEEREEPAGDHDKAIEIIEEAHAVAVAELDALESNNGNRAERRTTAKKAAAKKA